MQTLVEHARVASWLTPLSLALWLMCCIAAVVLSFVLQWYRSLNLNQKHFKDSKNGGNGDDRIYLDCHRSNYDVHVLHSGFLYCYEERWLKN